MPLRRTVVLTTPCGKRSRKDSNHTVKKKLFHCKNSSGFLAVSDCAQTDAYASDHCNFLWMHVSSAVIGGGEDGGKLISERIGREFVRKLDCRLTLLTVYAEIAFFRSDGLMDAITKLFIFPPAPRGLDHHRQSGNCV